MICRRIWAALAVAQEEMSERDHSRRTYTFYIVLPRISGGTSCEAVYDVDV
jgi:hypothetical protein